MNTSEKYISCWYIENNIIVGDNYWLICCGSFGWNNTPLINFSMDLSPHEKVRVLSQLKADIIYALNNNIPCSCTGCKLLTTFEKSKQKPAAQMIFGFTNGCNIKCIYCKDITAQEGPIDVPARMKVVTELEHTGLIDKNTTIVIAYGEISIHSKRQEILEGLRGHKLRIHSNCLIFDKSVSDTLARGNMLNTSIDAGTKETYSKIKGLKNIDSFDKTCDNIKKYAQTGCPIELKYIFLPGINDNEADLNGFIEFAKRIKPYCVILSRDRHNLDSLDDASIKKIAYLYKALIKYRASLSYYEYNENEHFRFNTACRQLGIKLEDAPFLHLPFPVKNAAVLLRKFLKKIDGSSGTKKFIFIRKIVFNILK